MTLRMGDGAFNINYINIKQEDVVLGVTPREESSVKIYPNPVSEKLTIELDSDPGRNASLKMYDSSGAVVRKQKLVTRKTELSTEQMKPGMYVLQIRAKDQTLTRKNCNRII